MIGRSSEGLWKKWVVGKCLSMAPCRRSTLLELEAPFGMQLAAPREMQFEAVLNAQSGTGKVSTAA